MINGSKLASDIKYYSSYSKFNDELGRLENWEESVDRVMGMHKTKFADLYENSPQFRELFEFATNAYKSKYVLASQRSLQWAPDPIIKHNSRMFNCLTLYADRPEFFQETMYWLLSGCGVGFSVQYRHVNKLPNIRQRTNGVKTFVIEDSIEGWSDSIGVLLSSFMVGGGSFPEYEGYNVYFDYSKIRPKGSKISGGFKAPGSSGLRVAHEKIADLLNSQFSDESGDVQLRPVVVYDVVMHSSDAVLSGGVRRSATLCLFSIDDQEMLTAKTGNWYVTNPQRARSNNSVALLRGSVTYEQFMEVMESVKQFGEPGFVFVDDLDILVNPCVEIGMVPKYLVQTEEDSIELNAPIGTSLSGAQGCNLTEINGGLMTTREIFLDACKASAIIGTYQASYTDFKYVGKVSKKIFDKEALLGASITGWMNNPDLLFDEALLQEGVAVIKKYNEIVAELIGINPAARLTCTKPSGNASVLLATASGIHGDHAPMYFRHIQMNKNEDLAQYIQLFNPDMVEESVWSENKTDIVVAIPTVSKKGSLYKDKLLGVKQLEYVKKAQQWWVEPGTVHERCTIPEVRHNISNTITVDDWDQVANYIWENKQYFAGISMLGMSGDRDYPQAPFTTVYTTKDIVRMYGDAALYASGLIVDAMSAFDNNLWLACSTTLDQGVKLHYNRIDAENEMDSRPLVNVWQCIETRPKILKVLLQAGQYPDVDLYLEHMHNRLRASIPRYSEKVDWVRRAKKFANNYFDGNVLQMTYCLKDVYNNHKWNRINKNFSEIDWSTIDLTPNYADVETLAAVACSGPNGCEIPT